MPETLDHTHTANARSVAIAAALTGGFMVAEIFGGLISGSLALLADAGHMLTDFASLGLAWFGFHLARRPADWKRTYGFERFAILFAFVNGITLFAIAAWIVVEAVRRFSDPIEVLGGLMLAVSIGGLVINIVAFFVLKGGDSENLNIRSAAIHVVGDLLGSVAAITASIVILLTAWTPIDPILSVVVALIILRSAWRVVADAGHILLEGTPPGLDIRVIKEDLQNHLPFVTDVHHLHAWSFSEKKPMITLHAKVETQTNVTEAIRQIKRRLVERFSCLTCDYRD